MMRLIGIIVAVCLTGALVHAHELRPGEVLFRLGAEQGIETERFLIGLELGENPGQYSVIVTERGSYKRTKAHIEADTPVDPRIAGFNRRYFCETEILFLTIRQNPPRGADIRAYTLSTHAFDARSLEYIGKVPAAFEDIAAQEAGADLGFEYDAPQEFGIVCEPGGPELKAIE